MLISECDFMKNKMSGIQIQDSGSRKYRTKKNKKIIKSEDLSQIHGSGNRLNTINMNLNNMLEM